MTDHHQPSPVPPPPPTTVQGPVYDPWQSTRLEPPRRRRIPRWIMLVGVATAVASVITFVTVLVWPSGDRHVVAGPLDFHGFAQVTQITFDERSRTTMTAVAGDRGYTAWEQDGDLHVVAFDLASGTEEQRTVVTGAARWNRLFATSQALLVLEYETSNEAPRSLFALDPETLEQRWDIRVRGDDRLLVTDASLGRLDRNGGMLRGLGWSDGVERWAVGVSENTSVLPVATPAGLAQPSDHTGANLSPGGGADLMVLVHPDRSMEVVETRDGGMVAERANVADPSEDLLLAYQDRLFVAQAQPSGYRVESYDLSDASASPQVIYTGAEAERRPETLAVCGLERVCVLDGLRFDDDSIEVVALDAAAGGQLWRREVPGGEYAIPVGEWLVVNGTVSGDPNVTVFDDDGNARVDQAGVGVRLNDGNVMLLGSALDTADAEVHAAGFPTGATQPVPIGRLPAVDPSTCNWNHRFVTCTSQDSAEIWKFADE